MAITWACSEEGGTGALFGVMLVGGSIGDSAGGGSFDCRGRALAAVGMLVGAVVVGTVGAVAGAGAVAVVGILGDGALVMVGSAVDEEYH